MGKLWDILQAVFGLLLVWVVLDMSVQQLWIYGFFNDLGGWLGEFAIAAYLIVVLIILQIVKAFTRD